MASILRRPFRYRYYYVTIVLIALDVLMFLVGFRSRQTLLAPLWLFPSDVLNGAWWQVITYMFIHASWGHIFLNMLALFMFGIQLEQRLGSTEFLLFYLVCGIGAGIVTALVNAATGQGAVPVVGASGAIFGVMLGFAAVFPDARIFILGILPMRAPVAVGVFALIQLASLFINLQPGVASLTHLSGLLFAWLYLYARTGVNAITVFFRRR